MEPIPEARTAARHLAGGDDLADGLRAMSQLALALVPSCVGASLTIVVDGEALTMTATAPVATVLDAVQYLDGGPCLDAAMDRQEVNVLDVLDEGRWQFYEHAATSIGVRASLSIPVGATDGQPPGALNLYASEPDAFVGKEQILAGAFGSSVDSLVTNADLSFRTRDASRELPRRLEDKARVEQAIGVLISTRGWSAEQARERLVSASVRADAPLSAVAGIVLDISVG